MDFFTWPARSPNLHSIEELWFVMVRKVYSNFSKFSTVGWFKEEPIKCWKNIDKEVLYRLVDSVLKTCSKIVPKKSSRIKY